MFNDKKSDGTVQVIEAGLHNGQDIERIKNIISNLNEQRPKENRILE